MGKTSFVRDFAQKYAVPCYSASELIFSTSVNSLKETTVSSLDANQVRLLTKIAYLKSEHSSFLLDGHFTLFTSCGVVPIAAEHFKNMGIFQLVLFIDSPCSIYQRLQKRGGIEIPLAAIVEHQKAEKVHSLKVAKELNIPLSVFDLRERKSFNVANELIYNVFSQSI